MSQPPDGARPGATDPRDLDPEDVLERDPHVLLDARYLGGLHASFANAVAPAETRRALLHMGFLHGLQDAMRIRDLNASPRGEPRCVPPLAMRYRVQSGPGGLEIRGVWPDRGEASARLAASAPGAAGCCAMSAGYTSGWLSGLLDTQLLAVEETCSADGHRQCRFRAREVAAWHSDPGRPDEASDALPFDAYRALIRARESRRAAERPALEGVPVVGIDRDSACVHIWGPVMVLPFGGAEEGLRTLDLLGRDPDAQEVSVVVVDLAHTIIDPAFGALALEAIVRSAERWGAETLVAEPSPLSEAVLTELEHPPLLVFKDLEQAIASAFQIAGAQRRLS